MADASDPARPDPAAATTPAEFVEAMRRLKRWTGLGYRQLEKRAVAGGQSLPRSTLTVALTRHTLPREDLVAAFAYACGCDENQTAQWIDARRSIAAGGVAAAPATDVVRLQAGRRRRIKTRTAIVLLALAMVATGAAYLLRPNNNPAEPPHNPGQAAPASPGSSQTEPPPSGPESSIVIAPVTAPMNTSQPIPVSSPATATTPAPPRQVQFPVPTTPPKPPTRTEPSRVPVDPGRDTIQLPGEPAIHCPTPYLGTHYGPLAQCTQQSGDQVRHGFYSPYTREFGPTTDWVPVVDKKWYDGAVLATDGVHAWARGYGTVNTQYGAGVWTTQYRDGEARWGVVNLVTNRFYPASTGWQPAGR
jgi:hypothetical protein